MLVLIGIKVFKMKTNVYLGIAIRIIVLFVVGMISTFIPNQLRDFFGDTPFKTITVDSSIYSYSINNDGSIDQNWIWGARHYWYFNMMLLLFLLSLLNVIVSIRNLVLKNYPESFKK